MPSAEIITIGTEILLGEIVDTNSAFLARHLRDLNVDVFRTSTVGDNIERIAEVIRETLTRTQIIITTGGLGPTVDDPTRDAIALAFGVETEFRPELWEQVVTRMQRFGRTPGENQKRQAYVPKGAIALENAVGTAPAFIVEQGDCCLISLPGVPREMEYLAEHKVFPYLREKYHLSGLIKARILHVAGMGESIIDEYVAEFELLANPTVGLAAHYGMVDVRITAKADSAEQADEIIAGIEKTIRERLGKAIFGSDGETLESATLEALAKHNLKLTVVEVNTGGELSRMLSQTKPSIFVGGQVLSSLANGKSLADAVVAQMQRSGASVALGLMARQDKVGELGVDMVMITPNGKNESTRGYGGHPKNVPVWGANILLDMLRRELSD